MTALEISKISKILVINPYGIGDVLFTTPLIRTLKKAYPQAEISALLGSRTKEVLAWNPDIKKIYVFNKGCFDSGSKLREIPRLIKLIITLKKIKFDLVLDLSNAPEYGFICKFVFKIPHRIGFNYKNRGRFLTQGINLEGFNDKHIIEYYLDLARIIGLEPQKGKTKFYIDADDQDWAKDFLSSHKIKNRFEPVIAVIPGGGSSWGLDAGYKHWPAESYARLSDMLMDKFKAHVILCGDKTESSIGRMILTLMTKKPIVASGRTSLGQLAALLAECDLVICNDGGPLHVAVAVGAKTLSIFGPVDEKVYGPYPLDEKHQVITSDVDCRPCYRNFKYQKCDHRKCLFNIHIDTILEKVSELLNPDTTSGLEGGEQ